MLGYRAVVFLLLWVVCVRGGAVPVGWEGVLSLSGVVVLVVRGGAVPVGWEGVLSLSGVVVLVVGLEVSSMW